MRGFFDKKFNEGFDSNYIEKEFQQALRRAKLVEDWESERDYLRDYKSACQFTPDYDLFKDNFIERLHKEIFGYLHDNEGFKRTSAIEMVKAMHKPKNVSVERAAQFRNFLINYPKQNSYQELVRDVSTLYVSKDNFPHGLGNSKYLRNAICNAFIDLPQGYLLESDAKMSFFSHQTKLQNKAEQNLYSRGQPRYKQYKQLVLCMAFLKQTQVLGALPQELGNFILELWTTLHIQPGKNADSCKNMPGFVLLDLSPPPVNLVTMGRHDKDDKELNEFVFVPK